VQVLEHELGLGRADRGVARDAVEDEGAQGVGIGRGDVDEVVVLAGDVEDVQRAGQPGSERPERVDVGPGVAVQPDGDEGLQRAPHRGWVDVGAGATQHAAGPQRPGAQQRRRRSHAGGGREIRVRRATVLAQSTQQDEVDLVQSSGAPRLQRLPKGLKRSTLESVKRALDETTTPLTADDVGQLVGIARVTARRYLEYLDVIGAANVEREYLGSGRPRNRYSKTRRHDKERP